jgi:nitrate reductase delta subunit
MSIAEYKILSFLLSYPSEGLAVVADEVVQKINASGLFAPARRAQLAALVAAMALEDVLDLQAEYVELFDRGRALSLHLFEHVHGESRDRGQAMVSLRERYQAAGLDISANELPDYLPLFLEFLSQQDEVTARSLLQDVVHIVQVLAERHARRGSRYVPLFEALQDLAARKADQAVLAELRNAPADNPSDLEALDRSWEEAEVRFGPGDAATSSCPRASEMLSRMPSTGDIVGEKA